MTHGGETEVVLAPPVNYEPHAEPNHMSAWYSSLPSWQEASERVQELSAKTSERVQELSAQASERAQEISAKTMDTLRKSTASTLLDTAEFVEKSSKITVDRMREAAPWVEGGPQWQSPARVEDLQTGDPVFRGGEAAQFVKLGHRAMVLRMQGADTEASCEYSQASLGVEASQQFLAVGARVCMVGLQSKPELNGCHGSLVEYSAQTQRWKVKLDSTGEVIGASPQKLSILFAPYIATSTSGPADELQVGTRVRLEGLQSSARLNGCQGVLADFDAQARRWTVKLDTTGETIRVQVKNLLVLRAP